MRTHAVPWEGLAGLMVVIAAAMLFGLSETPSEGFRVTLVVTVVASLIGSIFATWGHSRWRFALTGIALLLLMMLIGARALWGASAIAGKAGLKCGPYFFELQFPWSSAWD